MANFQTFRNFISKGFSEYFNSKRDILPPMDKMSCHKIADYSHFSCDKIIMASLSEISIEIDD